MAKKGYHGFRLEDVAASARVSKATVYRRWPSKQALVAEAVRAALAQAQPETPNSGDVRRDLELVLERSAKMLRGPLGAAIRTLVSEVMVDRVLSLALKQVEADRRRVMEDVVRRGVAEGVLAGEVELLVDALLGAAYFRLLVRQKAPDPALSSGVAGLFWRGV